MFNVLFLGQKSIAERCLSIITDEFSSSFNVCSIVSDSDFFDKFYSRGVPAVFCSNAERNEDKLLGIIADKHVNLVISVQHPWILSSRLLSAVTGMCFNLHNAKLPQYQGHNTLTHAILNGDNSYSSTIHWMLPEVDSGEIAYEGSVPITSNDTAYSLYLKNLDVCAEIFRKLIQDLVNGNNVPRITPEGTACYYRKNGLAAFKQINNPNDIEEIDKKARAFYFPPHEPAYLMIHGRKYHVVPDTTG